MDPTDMIMLNQRTSRQVPMTAMGFGGAPLGNHDPNPMIWVSDWLVCTLAATYNFWAEAVKALAQHLNDTEKHVAFGTNTQQANNFPQT